MCVGKCVEIFDINLRGKMWQMLREEEWVLFRLKINFKVKVNLKMYRPFPKEMGKQ